MYKGIAFLVVGHENWGKSKTLRAMTNDNFHKRYKEVAGTIFFIRRMSNDDRSDEYKVFVNGLDQKYNKNIILAFCPNMDGRINDTKRILKTLQDKYRIYAFVLKNKYGTSEIIPEKEIEFINEYCEKMYIYKKNEESEKRAMEFEKYIEKEMQNI